MKKTRKVIRIILLIAVSAMFLMSAFGKFTGNPQEVGLFEALNIPNFRIAAGIINLIIVATLWWRPTRNIGTLIASSYLGAAMLASFELAPPSALIPGLVLLAVWIIAKVSHRCGHCMGGGHCHCPCDVCKNCSASRETNGMCACKPGCVCQEGKCSC